ncbi:farnesylated protein 3 [Zea mays]|uniref:Farnesylated protein 3 n=1 Tax=Zea mays TaxID=4577 RepID=A0A1D6J5V1_MAIZE|nr:farnesylated protein 3 [Zea mays]
MRVYMHCEGCARKVKKILRRFDGVEDVIADSKAHKVLVKGKKAAADPMKVVERVQKKTGRKVELLSPMPPPPEVEEKKEDEAEKKKDDEKKAEPEPPKPEEKKEPPVIAVVLKVHMHCEACAEGIKKRILKMKGVQSVEPDLKASEVTVKGVFEESKLAEYVYKRTGKHAAVVKSEPAPAPEGGGGDKAAKEEEENKKDAGGAGGEEKKDGKEEEEKKDGGEKNEEKKDGGDGDGDKKDEAGDKDKDPAASLPATSGVPVRLPAGLPAAVLRAAAPPAPAAAHGAADLQRREPQRLLRHVVVTQMSCKKKEP